MRTPLFFVCCTTCEARIRFYDESRLGQIIPCPKCGSMVLVEKSVEDGTQAERTSKVENSQPAEQIRKSVSESKTGLKKESESGVERRGGAEPEQTASTGKVTGETVSSTSSKSGVIPPSPPSFSEFSNGVESKRIPQAPAVPGFAKPFEKDTLIAEERTKGSETSGFECLPTDAKTFGKEEKKNAKDLNAQSAQSFQLSLDVQDAQNAEYEDGDGEFETFQENRVTSRMLVWGMAGVAGGIFCLGVLVFLLLGNGSEKNPSLALKVPEKMNQESETEFEDPETAEESDEEFLSREGEESEVKDGEKAETEAGEGEEETVRKAAKETKDEFAADGISADGFEKLEAEDSELEDADETAERDASESPSGLSGVMQSELGRQLSDHFPAKDSAEPLPLTGIEGGTGSDGGAETVPESSAGENSGVAGEDGGESGEDSESELSQNGGRNEEENSENAGEEVEEESSDEGELKFTRRKRSRVYSGEESFLDFDGSRVTLDFDSSGKKDSGKSSEGTSKETEKDSGAEGESGEDSAKDSSGGKEGALESANPESETVENGAGEAEDGSSKESSSENVQNLRTLRIVPPEKEYLNEQIVERLNIPLESISISEKKVSDVLQFAAQMSGGRLPVDWKKMERLGIPMNARTSVHLTETSLREVVDTALYAAGLGLDAKGSVPKIVGWEAAQVARLSKARGEELTSATLNVQDLAKSYQMEGFENSGTAELAKIIPLFVHPALWEDANGTGKIAPITAKGQIRIEQQFPGVIREAQQFCEKMRRARNLERQEDSVEPEERLLELPDGTELLNAEITPRYESSKKVRQTSVNLDFSDGTVMRQALKEIFSAAEANLYIDERAILRIPITAVLPDAEVPDFEGNREDLPDSILDLPCVYRFEGIALEEAVSDILKNVPLVCFPLSETEFLLTTQEEMRRKMLVEFFPVGDIVNLQNSEVFLNTICEKLYPETWRENGGAGEIYFDAPSRNLIVRQNPAMLYLLDNFLTEFRSTENPEAKEAQRERNE